MDSLTCGKEDVSWLLPLLLLLFLMEEDDDSAVVVSSDDRISSRFDDALRSNIAHRILLSIAALDGKILLESSCRSLVLLSTLLLCTHLHPPFFASTPVTLGSTHREIISRITSSCKCSACDSPVAVSCEGGALTSSK